jgi:hydroxyacylglutathione hydrolase
MSKEKFIQLVTSGLNAPPQYFFKDAMINKNGYDNIEEVMKRNMKALSGEELKKEMANGALVLDTRIPDDFEKGFIKGSLNIGLNGQYAVWVGTLVDINQPLVIVSEEGKEEESILRLARVGYENVKGYLKGGIRTWINLGNSVDKIESITADEFASRAKAGKGKIIDVRKPGEYEGGHVKGAKNFSLAELSKEMDSLPKGDTCLIHCAGGYRSMIAASMLKAKGITNIINVYGGYSKIKDTGVTIVTSVPV